METHQEKSSWKEVFLRTIAVLGLIAVLILGAWGIIQLAVAIPTLFSNLGGVSSLVSGGSATEALAVSAPNTLASGGSLTVSWDHTNGSGDYSYTISYACQTGLSIKAPLPTGAYQDVPCNTPFDFVNATAHMTLIPTLTGTQPETLTLSVASTKLSTGAITSSGSAQTTITPSGTAATSAATTPAKTTTSSASASTYYPAATRAALYGYPDLAVQILSATPNGSTDQVQFEVENVGTNVAQGGWTFNAMLPINGSYTFMSQPQQALYPGDKIVYMLNFTATPANNYGYNNGYNTGYPTQYPYGYSYTNGQSYYTGTNYNTCNLYGPCNIPGYNNGITNYNTNYNYGYNSGYNYGTGTVTISADPYSRIVEANKANNSASITIPLY